MKPIIKTAKDAGFCYGVKRAVDRAAELGDRAVVYGRLIHNNDVLAGLESLGVTSIDELSEISDIANSGKTLLIRSHGVSKAEYSEILRSGAAFEDLTCPHVAKIHKIVAENSAKGHPIVIIGDKNHPEVRGIIGHIAQNIPYATVNSAAEAENLYKSDIIFRHNALIIVAQTTFDVAKWRDYTEIIKKHYTNPQIFDTICNTTLCRQKNARALAAESDLMVVLGSARSSNSRKLAEICGEYTRTVFIENASRLDIDLIKILMSDKADFRIGITAGASTPVEKIEEVHNIMSEELRNNAVTGGNLVDNNTYDNDENIDFAAEVDKTFKRVYIGNRVKATVVSVNRSEAVVDIGTKHSGYIPADELSSDMLKLPPELVAPGDEFDCVVTSINDAEGVVYLSKKKVDSALGMEKIAKAEADNSTLTGTVAAAVKGGVIIVFDGARVFVPASQSGVPKNGKLEDLTKKDVNFKVIEVNEARGRIVGSIRAAQKEINEAKRELFWSGIEEGKRFKGEVKSIENYGVFVDLGGVDGMVHLSELTWNRVRHPKEVVSVGDKLDVYVKSFDLDKKRVSLGAKDPAANPWTNFIKDYSLGDIVTAEIVSITPFGAFAQIMPGIDGLIHISQIARERVTNIAQVLEIGQKVDVKITDIDDNKNRISLSIKDLLEPLPEMLPEEFVEVEEVAETAEVETVEEVAETAEAETVEEVAEEPVGEGSDPTESEVVYSDDDKKPDEATGELPVQGDDN
ncbi:MAG: 4-hydroxy-3-methylbut-2-enyl diphosphate reductase [Oscillospiraceae bacterium]|nr:4-hydroxy-3-methylbut-2-enyl diphosphate reductase [Oscillospiraceae bacterium]